jgi:hypothetical protein
MAPAVPAKKKRDFDPRKFLATIGGGRKSWPFPGSKQSSPRGMPLTQSSIF